MATSNPYGGGKYKLNFGRAVSKRWKDASKVDYGGGWGDDDSDDGYEEPEPMSADNPRHPAWSASNNAYASNRSATNPSPHRTGQRPSFDLGDERRHVSSASGFNSAYPTAQRSPFPEIQHDQEPSTPNYGMQPPLRLNTQGQGPGPGPMSAGGFRPGSRGRQYPPYEDIPFSAPGSFPQQGRSGSGNRAPPPDSYMRHESPMRPDSRSSNASYRQYPLRKTSLSQQPPQPDFTHGSNSPVPSHTSGQGIASANEDRPPPVFIRPSDIYKRMSEEMEKVRKSQESSRPSIDSGPNRAREGSVGARSTSSEPKEPANNVLPMADDTDSTRRLKPTLDPVPERKSEYGFENLVKTPSRDNAQAEESTGDNDALGVSRHDTTASSVYTDRSDPVSASSISRNVSLTEGIPEPDGPSHNRPSFGLPPLDRMPGFGADVGLTDNAATAPTSERGQSATEAPPQVPLKDDSVEQRGAEPGARGLRHQPTMGYTSIVHQAFDQSQNQASSSPTSTSGTVDRSNSGSTADISPIISRKPDHGPTRFPIQPEPPRFLEQSSQAESRPTSSATVRPDELRTSLDKDLTAPAHVRPGYRRDVTPPSRDNSPAKRPFEMGHQRIPQPQHGSVFDEVAGNSAVKDPVRGRTLDDKPLPAEPNPAAATPDLSEPSAIPRAESPPKGKVRDLAGKLESTSGRSSPTNSTTQVPLPGLAQARPVNQSRLDSFRPAIPGGWQSYTSSAGSATPSASTPSYGRQGMSLPRAPFAQTRTESTESIPTARAPANLGSREEGVTQRAFAAAASAGSALAGALTGHSSEEQPQDSHEPSEEESENEWDVSSSSSNGDVAPPISQRPSHEQTMAYQLERPQQRPTAPNRSPAELTADLPPPAATSTPLSQATSNEADVPPSTLDYFPAPLRTSRLVDNSSFRPAIPNLSISQETPQESENERLQQEIVKSLTPKSSDLRDEANYQGRQPQATTNVSAYARVTQAGSSPHRAPSPEPAMPQPREDGLQGISAPRATTQRSAEAFTTISPPPSIKPQPVEAVVPSDGTRSMNVAQTPNRDTAMPSQPPEALQHQAPRRSNIDTAFSGTREQQPSTVEEVPASDRPFLQQRFSWETGSSPPPSGSTPKHTSPPSTSSPDTIRAQFHPRTSSVETTPSRAEVTQPISREATLPPQQPMHLPQIAAPEPPQQPSQMTQLSRAPTNTQAFQSPRSPSDEPPTFRTIMNLGSPADRIKAFEDSRQFYAAPNEELQSWLMSMKSPENSDLFAANGRHSVDAIESAHKPSPRRILTESVRAQQMQEDGKKLMAAAGRFGGKAGHAAKGLFAKGKGKMRSASSGEKVVR